jgi:hypothetical protein
MMIVDDAIIDIEMKPDGFMNQLIPYELPYNAGSRWERRHVVFVIRLYFEFHIFTASAID